jgi:hypothetical protein
VLGNVLNVTDQYVEILTPYDNTGGYTGTLMQTHMQTVAGALQNEILDFQTIIQTISGNDVEHFTMDLEIEIQRLA